LISLFAFIVVLGIVVDDAIVVGENIYTHQQRYGPGIASTVNGAKEVARPVVFGVLTTVAAFYPLLQVDGNTGKILRFIPLIVIPTLLFSLIECLVILPAHLRGVPNIKKKDYRWWSWFRFQKGFADAAESLARRIYKPALEFCLNWRYLTVSSGVALLFLTLAGYDISKSSLNQELHHFRVFSNSLNNPKNGTSRILKILTRIHSLDVQTTILPKKTL